MGTNSMDHVQTWLTVLTCLVGVPHPALSGSAARSQSTPAGLHRTISWQTTRMPIDRLLLLVAHRYKLPMSIVIAAPVEPVTLPAGPHTGREALRLIGAAGRGYSWARVDSSIWFVSPKLELDPQNFLSWRLPWVDLFGTVGRFIGYLQATVAAAPTVPHGLALSSTGPLELTDRLPSTTLRNTSARAVLRLIMQRSPKFSSLIVFPRARHLTRADALAALSGWRWVALEAEPPQPLPSVTGSSPRGGTQR